MHESMDSVINYAELCKDIDESLLERPIINNIVEYENIELTEREFKLFGFYLTNHPVTKYKRDNLCNLNNLNNYFDKVINVIGMVEYIKEIKTKKGDNMAFISISDEYKKVTAVLFPKIYEKNYSLKTGNIIKINAKVEKRMSELQLIVNNLEKLN